jgi:uncharacterized protein YdeI (YjbR/CyaY-like superfamily)
MTPKLFRTRAEWRTWLERNHDTAKEIWLAYYKKSSGKKSVTYEEALEEALCFGWIDSIVKKLDAERYIQKYTPRKNDSIWSASNKARVKKLIAEGRMAGPGLAKITIAKKNGSWMKIDRIDRRLEMPPDLSAALEKNPAAKNMFETLAPSYKKMWGAWVDDAKRPETRARRIAAALEWIEAGRKPGIQVPRLTPDKPRQGDGSGP